MGSLIDKGKVADKISDLFLDKYEAKANSGLTEFYKEVLKILINEKGQSDWISVKKRLPERDGFYLAWYTFNDGRHACDIFYYNYGYSASLSSAITHWMTLPEPPESENDVKMNIDELIENTKKKFEEETPDKLYYYGVYDALIILKDLMSHGNCNDCSNKKECIIVPKYGESVRWNCAFYKEKNSNE